MRAYGATAPDLQQIKPCRLASGAAIKEHPNAVGTGTGRCPGPDGRPTAKPTRRMGIKACGLSPMPAREPTEEAMDELANPSNASNQVFLLFLSVGWCVVAYATADAYVFSSV